MEQKKEEILAIDVMNHPNACTPALRGMEGDGTGRWGDVAGWEGRGRDGLGVMGGGGEGGQCQCRDFVETGTVG